ncbi:ABC transporter ATP-binding protein [Halococcus sediminicola]|uniref:ABC transporter ATP-binding protein n=1 Tax=Halococcus sediminicola TaxID=1264579 RepID=UPI000679CD45|nr:ABC transporter ATP-binding protein [Halococcus sediminicola]
MTESTAPLLEVDRLKKYFPVKEGILKRTNDYVRAVDGVSFDIRSGETMALIGESGSGKSTVAKTIVGLHEPTDGTIHFDGTDITHPSGEQLDQIRSRMQMVFQDPTASLNPRRTVGKSMGVPMKARGVPTAEREDRISELLDLVELNDEYLYKYPHELSGGQKQRINIARAISIEPELLLLDEPTSALDVSVQAKIIGLLEDLQDELGLTYLFITHDLSLVRNFADETAVMYLGQIQEKGETTEVFHHPRHPYSRSLLSAIPVTSEEEEAYKPRHEPLEGEIPSPRNIPSGCRFHTRCPYAQSSCTEVDPAFTRVESGPRIRCHIYDAEFREEFDDVPDVALSPSPMEGTRFEHQQTEDTTDD